MAEVKPTNQKEKLHHRNKTVTFDLRTRV